MLTDFLTLDKIQDQESQRVKEDSLTTKYFSAPPISTLFTAYLELVVGM